MQLADGSGDAFLHVSVVERSGHDSVPPGATLEAAVNTQDFGYLWPFGAGAGADRWRSPEAMWGKFARDSPLEQAGFEPLVPRSTERTSAAASDLQEETRRHRINPDE